MNKRTVQAAQKTWMCSACLGTISPNTYYVKDQELKQIKPGSYISGQYLTWHLQCAPQTRMEISKAMANPAKTTADKIKEFLVRVNDLPCTTCGRDNRNGTHDALEKAQHLAHSFTPSIPDPLAREMETAVADASRPAGMEFSSSEEMIASLRHIALNGCRCESDDDLFSQCACDAARTAQLTLEQLNIGLIP